MPNPLALARRELKSPILGVSGGFAWRCVVSVGLDRPAVMRSGVQIRGRLGVVRTGAGAARWWSREVLGTPLRHDGSGQGDEEHESVATARTDHRLPPVDRRGVGPA